MIKKLMRVLLAAAMVLSFAGCTKKPEPKTAVTPEEFQKLMNDWFVEDLKDDYIGTHFTLVHPEKYGLDNIEVTLGDAVSEDDTGYAERISKLESMDISQLNEEQQLTYKTVLACYKFYQPGYEIEKDYTFAFTPNSGVNNNLVTNFTEFALRSEQDAKDLIVLVKDSKRYIQQCIDYTKEQFEDGICQSDNVIDSIIEQCERFIENRETNEVIKAYRAQLDRLQLEDADEYEAQMKDAVLNYLIPAYEDIIAMYNQIKGSGKSKGTMSAYGEDGKRTYEFLFKNKASSTKDVSEWEATLRRAIRSKYDELMSIYSKSQTSYNNWADVHYDQKNSYGLTDAYEIFTALKQKMAKDFPDIPEYDYTIEFLDPSVTSDNVAAYYLVAPYDDPNINVVKANPNFGLNDPDGYVITLSHEGYPGHLFQHTYYTSTHPDSEIRYNLNFIGYAEGWAMYVEDFAYGYFEKNTTYAKLSRIDNALNYYLEAYIDILVNYENYSVSKIGSVLDELGFNASIAQDLYDTVSGDPCLFVPYALGLYQMNELKDKAKKELGNNYSNRDLNTVILNTGDTSFEILTEEVNKYIEKNK